MFGIKKLKNENKYLAERLGRLEIEIYSGIGNRGWVDGVKSKAERTEKNLIQAQECIIQLLKLLDMEVYEDKGRKEIKPSWKIRKIEAEPKGKK